VFFKSEIPSDALDTKGQGTIDFVNQKLDINAYLKPLATVDKALDFMPLVGKAVQGITEIQIDTDFTFQFVKDRL
jgi:hypothetical protein